MTRARGDDDDDLPIDVAYSSLLVWLQDRRHIPKDWHLHLKRARTLAHTAYVSTPIAQRATLRLPTTLTSQDAITHHHVTTALAHLPQSPDLDLLLRRPTDPVHRAWHSAQAAYKTHNVFLADLAQHLVRNTDVVAPSLRTSIASFASELTVLLRRHQSLTRASERAHDHFHSLCEQYDVDPQHDPDFDPDFSPEQAVVRFVQARLPQALTRIASTLTYLELALALYQSVADSISSLSSSSSHSLVCVTLRALMDAPHSQLIPPPTDLTLAPGVVDWDICVTDEGLNSTTTITSSDDHPTPSTPPDYDLSTSSPPSSSPPPASTPLPKTATLADGAVRDAVIDDLHELNAFFAHLLRSEDHVHVPLVPHLLHNLPSSLRDVSRSTLHGYKTQVADAVHAVTDPTVVHMLAMQRHPTVLHRAVASIQEARASATRLDVSITSLLRRRASLTAQRQRHVDDLAALREQTAEVRKRAQVALTDIYNGRPVHIFGQLS